MEQEDKVCLRLVSDSNSPFISREEAKKLWKQGKLAGLFNIPFENESLFLSCKDFCMEKKEEKDNLLLQEKVNLEQKIENIQVYIYILIYFIFS